MKQQRFKRQRYFHFTTKFVHPKWFEMSLYRNWLDWLKCLEAVKNNRASEGITWHAALLMSNHLHLLLSTQSYNEHSLVLDIEKEWQKQLQIKTQLFQRPLPCEPLDHFEHLRSAYKYIYRNPVEAGVVRNVEDYPYSSLALILNRTKPTLSNPFIDPFEIIHDLPRRLSWLNTGSVIQQSFDFYELKNEPGVRF